VAKVVGAPIFHANADDPEAVCLAFNYAAEWRQTFGSDVVVDVVGYRRQGHNEQDDPQSTLPKTHRLIAEHPRVFSLYKAICVEEGAVTESQIERWQHAVGCVEAVVYSRCGSRDYRLFSLFSPLLPAVSLLVIFIVPSAFH
jgi:2-oxoglutarate dehydrogenase complex dehydrogenase (E1) component-like enzyme